MCIFLCTITIHVTDLFTFYHKKTTIHVGEYNIPVIYMDGMGIRWFQDLVSRRLKAPLGSKGFPPDAPTHVDHTCDPSNPFNPWCRPGVPSSGHTGTTYLAGRAEEMGWKKSKGRKDFMFWW